MKRLIPIFLIAFLLLCWGSAFSYEIRISAGIPPADKSTGISVNTSTGFAAVVSGTKNLHLVDANSTSVIKTIPLAAAPSAVAIDEKTNTALVFSHDGILNFIELDSGSLTKAIVTWKVIYSDYAGDWKDFKDKLPIPFHVSADFNGDGITDNAWILSRTRNVGWGLFVFLSEKDGNTKIIQLQDKKGDSNQNDLGLP